MSREETYASPFAALFEWERNTYAGGGGKARTEVLGAGGSSKGPKLRPVFGGEKRFNQGQRLFTSKVNNIVKVKYVKNNHDAARHIIQHIDYIQKRERSDDEPERKFYGRDGERHRDDVIDSVIKNRGDDAAMFKIILSPKQNELDHIKYASEIMERFEEKSGIKTDWSMVQHRNTQFHHVHIVMPGRDVDGHSYRLEPEHVQLFKEIANSYQYELQGINYEREMEIQREFGFTRDEANLLYEAHRDIRDMKDLGVYRPDIDVLVRQTLLPDTNFDDVYFAQQLQKEVWKNVSDDFRSLQSEIAQKMQEQYPELYPGFVKEMQAQEINNAFFHRLKDFHPAEYWQYVHNPELDRRPVFDRLKQAFPEWFDPIVEELKLENPALFSDYEKPGASDRQIIQGLQKSNPELFPELSRQIQESQLNSFVLAMLAEREPARLDEIFNEQDATRQRELFESAKQEYPDYLQFAKDQLAIKFPKIYEHSKKEGPSDTEVIKQLVIDHPELFPEAAKEIRKNEIDIALFEAIKERSPEFADQIEFDPEKRGIAINFLRWLSPEELDKATEKVKAEKPGLFPHEKTGPSEHEIMIALQNSNPELFPKAMQALKRQEIDRAYFEKGTELMPDGLKPYVDDPSLARKEIIDLLKASHPEWMPEIEKAIKEKNPALERYFSEKSDEQIIKELIKTHPHLFPQLKREAPEDSGDRSEEIAYTGDEGGRLEKLLAAKERLVEKAYFERGRELMSDGLSAYIENVCLDRDKIVQALQKAYPEWRMEIESELAKTHVDLFSALDAELGFIESARAERDLALNNELADQTRPDVVEKESNSLVSIARLDPKQEKGLDKSGLSDEEKQEETERAEGEAEDALYDAQNLKTGHEWDGLTSFMHSAFVDEPLDLKAEADALFASQRQITEDIKELGVDIVQLAPEMLKLMGMLDNVEAELDDIERDSDERTDL